MLEWEEKLKNVLKELGADKQLVTGAKVKELLTKSALDPGEFDRFLKEKGLKFSDFVLRVEGIKVQKRGASDMLVGFPGADWPTPNLSTRIPFKKLQMRDDVYNALTSVSNDGYYFLPDSDKFIEGPPPQRVNGVPLPKVPFSELINERRDFATRIKDPIVRDQLLDSLDHTPNPLATFQYAVNKANLGESWHIFKFGLMRTNSRNGRVNIICQYLLHGTICRSHQKTVVLEKYLFAWLIT